MEDKTFRVTVIATHEETYFVNAANEQEARENWSDTEPEVSDCLDYEVDSVREEE